jgi:hypothetical protein
MWPERRMFAPARPFDDCAAIAFSPSNVEREA